MLFQCKANSALEHEMDQRERGGNQAAWINLLLSTAC
jgi:hypothetical protein